jgi:ribosomal protein S18 acetylase RimI-like enzyme
MKFDTVPTSDFPVPDLVKFLNQGFEDYLVPIHFNTVTFLNMLRKDGIDLTISCLLIVEDQPCGIALVARRGWTSRLAAMGIAKEIRGQGAGSWFMDELIKEALQRGDREMVLEVIEQNEPAVKLYQRSGFQTVRRLIGFTRTGHDAHESKKTKLQEVDLREISRLIAQHGISDLPWQISGESIAQMNPPARGYEKDRSYIVVSNPILEHVVIWSLLVEQAARRQGLATDLLKTVMANHVGKTWHVPAILPEEFGRVFEKAGFEREQLSQWQMRLHL